MTGLLLAALSGGAPPRAAPLPAIQANDNRRPAGTLRRGVLDLRLVATEGLWYPDEDQSPPLRVQAFAVEGGAPTNPGPLIRVRAGTRIRIHLRNRLTRPLVVHGLYTRPARTDDTVQVAPGAVRDVSFDAGEPGTYLYWASSTGMDSLEVRTREDSQLSGAIVVDPSTGAVPADRILVIGNALFPPDTVDGVEHPFRFLAVLNGRSWPHTERLLYTVGDSVRFRLVNVGFEPHPMHLHGFFFRVASRGGMRADTLYPQDEMRGAVTEIVDEGTTHVITWVPETAGNWLLHCHIRAHIRPTIRYPFPPGHAAPHAMGNHALDGMAGLVVGITVRARPGTPAPSASVPRRSIRMEVVSVPGRLGRRPGLGVRFSGAVWGDSVALPYPAPPLVLVRGEPVRVTVVNHLADTTAIHWHGLELESYFDGVPGWSGAGARVAPLIAPGDSFQADLTPPRAGTFIYHSHMEAGHQRGDGLYGALIVLERGETFDPATDLVWVLGGRSPNDPRPPLLNGDTIPAPIALQAGRRYRIRIVNICENDEWRLALTAGGTPVRWEPIAKDAAPVPASARHPVSAELRIAVGETYDFGFTAPQSGALELRFLDGTTVIAAAPITVR